MITEDVILIAFKAEDFLFFTIMWILLYLLVKRYKASLKKRKLQKAVEEAMEQGVQLRLMNHKEPNQQKKVNAVHPRGSRPKR